MCPTCLFKNRPDLDRITARTQILPGRTLEELEHDIQEGLAKYQVIGIALVEIHSRQLYKPQYMSFEAYVKERWEFSERTAIG